MIHAGNKFCFDVCRSVTLLFVSIYTGEVYCLMLATPPHIKKTSPRIWTNHRNDQNEFQNRGNPRFRGTISCLNYDALGQRDDSVGGTGSLLCSNHQTSHLSHGVAVYSDVGIIIIPNAPEESLVLPSNNILSYSRTTIRAAKDKKKTAWSGSQHWADLLRASTNHLRQYNIPITFLSAHYLSSTVVEF